ncbi:MAG: SGNH/GDSL hydrolase family protein [Pyrinomonadaceae bacterium]
MNSKLLVAVVFVLVLSIASSAQLSIQAIDVAGDSISKGFNASSAFPCSNGDQETYNWLTSDTHGSNLCGGGNEGVFSVLERMECDTGTNIIAAQPNHAVSGSTLVRDLASQAVNVRTYLTSQPSTRLAVVFLGHNDNCSGTITKANTSCSSTDLDPANYCKTKPETFERELRRGLDVLMSIGNTRVGIVSPVRVSQLCNFGAKANCQLGGSCQALWGLVSICASLTRDCSSARVVDSYSTMKIYHDILKSVTAEYAAIPDFGSSQVITIGGQTVGGGVKASGTEVIFSDGPWYYKFSAEQLSCCDCFHPSAVGQDTLGRMLKTGLMCSRISPCCKDTGDPLVDGRCSATSHKNTYYRGLL